MTSSKLSVPTIKYLTELYTNPKNPGSLGGIDALYRKVKEDGTYALTKPEIRNFLISRDEYTLHKPVTHKFDTHHIVVGGPNQLHQGDLVDMGYNSAKFNDNVHFLLVIYDCFTKMAFVQPLQNKTGKSVLEGLMTVYKDRDTPTSFTSDSGKEFVNKVCQKWFNDNDIRFSVAHGIHKAMFVEKYNKFLKTHLSRYMTLHNTLRYIDILQDVVTSYNNTYNTVTGYKPVDVNETNAKEIFLRMYGSPNDWFKNLKKPKFQLGTHVRITRQKGKFEKGYEETYTREIFVISKILNTNPREYKIKSLKGDEIEGRFYEKELADVIMSDDTLYPIEKIIRKRTRNGVKQYYVKYKGWDASHNEWVNENQIDDI